MLILPDTTWLTPLLELNWYRTDVGPDFWNDTRGLVFVHGTYSCVAGVWVRNGEYSINARAHMTEEERESLEAHLCSLGLTKMGDVDPPRAFIEDVRRAQTHGRI